MLFLSAARMRCDAVPDPTLKVHLGVKARSTRHIPGHGLSTYTTDDLFHQDALDHAVEQAMRRVVRDSAGIDSVLVVGAPVQAQGRLFNCGIVIDRGRILGVAPKSYLPNYREFYEK